MATVATAEQRPRFSASYRTWLLTLLVAIYACSFIDRIIVATIGQAIKVELKLSDTQFGLLTGPAFALFYATFGIPVAWLAERWSRINIICIATALWSAMTMLSGTAVTYPQLLLYRMGVGVGEGGVSPAAQSLLSDHYPAAKRGSVLAIYAIGVPIGSMLGALGGGWLAQSFDWRTAFVVVGAPGLVLAVLARLTLREPQRGLSDGAPAAAKAPGLGVVLKRLLSSPTVIHMSLGCLLTNLAANGMSQFTPSYFVRSFGMGLRDVGLLYGLVVGASGTIGMLVGGFGADFAARRDRRWYGWLPAIGSVLALPLYLMAFSRSDPFATAGFIFVGYVVMSSYFAPTFAVLQNSVEPRMRATAAALMLLLMNVFGQGIGPTAMGIASDMMAKAAFTLGDFPSLCRGGVAAAGSSPGLAKACIAASAVGLQQAILAMTVFFLWGAVHFLLAARAIARERPR
jgi:predicted MFS family arabinose efflux permease